MADEQHCLPRLPAKVKPLMLTATFTAICIAKPHRAGLATCSCCSRQLL